MTGLLLPILARWGVPERFQRVAAIAALILGFLALCGLVAGAWVLWMHHHDKQVTVNHDAQQAAKVTTTELEAERTANANDEVRRQDRETKTDELNAARDEAQRSNPDETSKSAGPSTRAVLDGLRRQAAGDKRPAG